MEKGFYNSEIGYWQTVGGDPKVSDYGAGTIKVPLKPSDNHEWQDGEWVYAPPSPPTPEELRAQMPTLTRRQFWLAAHDLGVTKTMVLAFTADNLPLQIEVEESTEFHRTYEAVTILAPLLGITPEQLDDVWMWAANV